MDKIYHYKKIMDFHNVSAIIQDEIIELIENLDLNDPRVQSFLVQLDSIEIFDKRKLINHSKSFVFLLSKCRERQRTR